MKNFIRNIVGRTYSRNVSKISITQLTTTYDKDENFRICEDLMEQACEEGSEFIFYPECFLVVGTCPEDILKNAEIIDSELIQKYLDLARKHDIFVSYGGFYEYDPKDQKYYNTHIVVNNLGEIVSNYRKIHLFDIDLPDYQFQESLHVSHGSTFTVCENTPIGTCGLTTCYDLRFAECYIYLSNYLDSDVLLIPASNSIPTGTAHWHILMQSRAIENQCYVIAAAQTGAIDEKRDPKYGHALVVDPFGKILVEIKPELTNCVETIDIDLDYIEEVRKYMPCRDHRERNNDVYKIKYYGE